MASSQPSSTVESTQGNNNSSNNNNNSSNNNNLSPSSKALSMEAALRYKHDMADARAMMAAKNNKNNNKNHIKKKQPLSTQQQRPSIMVATPQQVQVALQAMDEAQRLHERAKSFNDSPRYLQQALVLYQESIQIVLSYLRAATASAAATAAAGNNKNLVSETLQARIQTALTDAEQIKATLLQKEQQQQPQHDDHDESSATIPPQQKSSLFPSWFYSATGTNTNNNNNNNNKPQHPAAVAAPAVAAPTKPQKPAPQPAAARPAPQKPDSPPQQQQQKQRQQKTRPTRTTPSNNNNTNGTNSGAPTTRTTIPASSRDQAFQNQVLDDFYIPSSTLQKTTWDDVAGLQDVKQALQESVILPLQRPDLFTGLRRPQNLLLYGPPGTGKTLLVRATASTSRALLFQCSAASLTSKWMGDAEKVVRALFQVATAAALQHQTPALLFLDEVDSVLSNRSSQGEHEASRRLKTEFMIQMEGLAKHTTDNSGPTVLVLACTNCPWDLDPAVLRRFPRRLYVPLPDVEARRALLQHLLESQLKNDHSLVQKDINELAVALQGYSGSDIYAIASQAAFGPIRDVSAQQLARVEKLRPVSRQDWNVAIAAAPPKTVTPKLLQQYQEWANQQ